MRLYILPFLAILTASTLFSCKNVAPYAIDEKPKIAVNKDLVGIWKMKEDTDVHNFFVIERKSDNSYALTYMNKGSSNRRFENCNGFFSKVETSLFLNVGYFETQHMFEGFFFLKVEYLDPKGWDMTLRMVNDTTMRTLPNSKSVRDLMAKNINNPSFFYKPLHFHKILPLMYCN